MGNDVGPFVTHASGPALGPLGADGTKDARHVG